MSSLLASTQINNPAIAPTIGGNPNVGPVAISALLRGLITLGIGLGAAIFLLMLLRGGLQYITAGSDKESVQKATQHIRNALIGIVVTLSIYAIAWTVSQIFGISLLQFTIPMLTP